MFKYLEIIKNQVEKGFLNFNNFKNGYVINSNNTTTQFNLDKNNNIVYKEEDNEIITFGFIAINVKNNVIKNILYEYYNSYYLNLPNLKKYKDNKNKSINYYNYNIKNLRQYKILMYYINDKKYKYVEFDENNILFIINFNIDFTSHVIEAFNNGKLKYEIKLIQNNQYSYIEYHNNGNIYFNGNFESNYDNINVNNLQELRNKLYSYNKFDINKKIVKKLKTINNIKLYSKYIKDNIKKIIKYEGELLIGLGFDINDDEYSAIINISNKEYSIIYTVKKLNISIVMVNNDIQIIKNDVICYDIEYLIFNSYINIDIKNKYSCDYNGQISNEKFINISINDVESIFKIINKLFQLYNEYIYSNKNYFSELLCPSININKPQISVESIVNYINRDILSY